MSDHLAEIMTQSRLVTWAEPFTDVATIASMSGLEYLQHLVDTRRQAPIGSLMDVHLVSFGPGVAVFEGIPQAFHYNPIGAVHGGFAATILDSAVGCAIHTTLKAGLAYTTIELKVNYTRPLRLTTGLVKCEGRVIHAGSRVATAEGRLTDLSGKLYAHATTSCLVFPIDQGVPKGV